MTDVYKVGVSLVMSGNYAQVLGALSSQLLGINKQVKELEGGFSKLKLAIVGALGAYAGTKILETMGTMVKYGDELVHQQNLMRAAGMSNQQIAEATARAYQTSAQVQTTTIAENLKHLKELRYAFGDLGKAQQAIGLVSQANAVMQATTDHDYSDQIWYMVKLAEMTNRSVDMDEFNKFINGLTRDVTGTGGKVDPQQLFQAGKYGRTAAQGWSDEFWTGALPRLIQSMGGGSGGGGGRAGPGNALMSAYQEIVQGQIPKKALQAFGQMGLTGPGGISGKGLFTTNPYEWVQQVLGPALAAKGVIMPNMSEEDIKNLFSSDDNFGAVQQRSDALGVIARMLPNRTASQVIAEMLLQGRFMMGDNSQFEKDIRLQRGAMDTMAYPMLMNKDFQTNMRAFTAQWHSMLEAIGSAMVPTAIEVLKNFTNAFTSFAQVAGQHPDLIANLAKGLGVLGVALVGGGAIAILAALGPAGWIAAGIIALGGAFVSWGPQIESGLKGLGDSLKSFWDKLKDIFKNGLPSGMMPGGAAYYGGGAYGHTQPLSYTTYGSGGPGSAPLGGGNSGVASPSFGGGGSLPHFTTGTIRSALSGGSIASPLNPGALPMGNLPIAGGVDRSRFTAELQQKPWLINKMAAMVAGETGGKNDFYSKTVLAEAFNRAQTRGISLEQALLSVSESRLGYYAGLGAPGGGTYGPRALAWARNNLAHFKSNVLGPVLGGWDEASRMAGFEITGNASGSVAAHQIMRGTPHFKIGAETYFHEGPFKHPIPHLTDRPPDMYGIGPHNPAYSAWQWHHNFSSSHSPIPSSDGGEVHVHHTTNLDGRVIARNTMKHMVRAGNMQSVGTRLHDSSLTRPMPV